MGRKRNVRRYSILHADSLCCVSADRVYYPESDPEESLMDQLQCPVADEVLIALRKSFSLTFPRNPFIEGVREALMEVRRLCVEAVKPLQEALSDLQLPPVPPYMNDPVMEKTHVFQFVFARTNDIDVRVSVSGKTRKLLNIIDYQDATALLTTVRQVVSDTFLEVHDEDQHTTMLRTIRHRIWSVLPDFNACLDSIELERIAAFDPHFESDTDTDSGAGDGNDSA